MKKIFEKLIATVATATVATSALAVKINAPNDINNFSPAVVTVMSGANAATASKWQTARTLALAGPVTGSASIDGSGNVTITTSITGSGCPTCLIAANNFSDITNITTAKTNLGLGTAAVANTGTSGHTVPYLDANDVFSGSVLVNVAGGGMANLTTQGEGQTQFQTIRYSNDINASVYNLRKSRGTIASASIILQNDQLGRLVFQGNTSATTTAAYNSGASIIVTTLEPTPSSTALGSQMTLSTAPLGSISPAIAVTISPAQNVTLNAGLLLLKNYTVAGLPACAAGTQGGVAYVTDATAPTYLGVLVGGGAVKAMVFCNGTAWVAS